MRSLRLLEQLRIENTSLIDAVLEMSDVPLVIPVLTTFTHYRLRTHYELNARGSGTPMQRCPHE